MYATPSQKPVWYAVLGIGLSVQLLTANVVQADEPIDGQNVFERYCAICHGLDGKGQGPMAEVLKPTASDLTLLAKWNQGEFPYGQVYDVIEGKVEVMGHGTSQMPIWGDAFARDPDDHTPYARIMELVLYLRSIQEE